MRVNGVRRYAHVVAWEEVHGPVPDGYEIDHLCENKGCRRLDHLEAVTHEENCERHYARQATCKNGHSWTPENTYIRREGTRVCRACRRENMRRYASR